jgi:hypothetical protein
MIKMSMRLVRATVVTFALVSLAGCGDDPAPPVPVADTSPLPAAVPDSVERNRLRNPYFGDLHVHTTLSFDAFIFGTRATPDDAYEFAKGGALAHPAGLTMKMKKPLDFQAVTDHGVYLGMLRAMFDESSTVAAHPVAVALRAARTPAERAAAFQSILPRIGATLGAPDDLLDQTIVRGAWQEIIAAAERHNDPGRFTTFIGYEYTSSGPEFENLHRNVIFRASNAPDAPFTRLDSTNPEQLWAWLDAQRAQGREALAIPHNSNGSNGWMFSTATFAGEPIDAEYARTRMRNEPIVEITQVKGTSETHPLLSPNDEWADFEIMPLRVASVLPSQPPGSYAREAWRNGLALEASAGANPFRFGVIGSSDTHNAAGSFEEDNYWSKTGLLDATPQRRGSVPLDEPDAQGNRYANPASQYWGGSGLAGVWAEANTREDLYQAMRRKETFATSGPHIPVRYFAGYGFDASLLAAPDPVSAAYAGGVPMGADLVAAGARIPAFFVWATRDADSAPLQRLQIVKGWETGGNTFERVFDVACSNGGTVDPSTRRCPDNGASVDLATCSISTDLGAAELAAVWQDPEFDPAERAFYYARVLENPKCRWSTWDAIRAGVELRPDMHATIQDRAWSSPIWYVP